MDGSVALAGAAQERMSLPQIPKFNPGEYLSKAISEMKQRADSASVMSKPTSNNFQSAKIDYKVKNSKDAK